MKNRYALFALVLLSGVACAEEGVVSTSLSNIVNSTEKLPWAVATGFESKHLGDHPELNGHNRGVGVRTEGGWMLGGYYNSYRRYSVYAGREFQWRMLGAGDNGLNFGVVTGAVSGYTRGIHAGHEHGISLMVLPELVAVTRYVEISLLYVPEATKTPATIALQVRVRWP